MRPASEPGELESRPAAPVQASAASGAAADDGARERERALLDRARQGDRAAFEALVTEAWDGLIGFAASMAGPDGALDLAQESVLKAMRGLPSFRGEARFRSWLCKIARNTFLNERARLHVKRERGDPDALEAAVGRGAAPERAVELEEVRGRLAAAIDALPEAQRTALLLCDRDGLSYKEIAEVMGTPIGTVMSRIYYARTKLKDRLGDLRGL